MLNAVATVPDLEMKAGDSFSVQFTFPADMSEWTFTAQWRTFPSATDAVDFAVDTSQVADGIVIISLTPEQTRASARDGVYDLQGVAADATVQTFLTGATVWKDDVTRA